MKNKSLITKVITGSIAAGLIFSSVGIAFAQSSTTGASSKSGLTQKMDRQNGPKKGMNPESMKTNLNKLVTAGTITADEETKIINYIKQKDTERQAEMDKVKTMTETERQAYFAQKGNNRPDLIKELVDASIISQAKADAIKAALPAPNHDGARGDKGPKGAPTTSTQTTN